MKYKWKERVTEKKIQSHAITMLRFCEASVGCVLIEYAGMAQKRLTEFYEGVWRQYTDGLSFYADARHDVLDATLTLLAAQERELKAIGVDVSAIDSEFANHDKFSAKWRNNADKLKHDNRAMYIKQSDSVTRGYHYSALLWFNAHKGFGAKRLTDLYKRLREEWCKFCGCYLECTAECDAKAEKMIKDFETRLEEKNIKFEYESEA